MRLIDADALEEKAYWHGERPDVGNPFAEGVEAVDMSDIDNAPTIEAEPVVRCKDCGWLHDGKDDYCCMKHTGMAKITPESFCSYGERRADDATD